MKNGDFLRAAIILSPQPLKENFRIICFILQIFYVIGSGEILMASFVIIYLVTIIEFRRMPYVRNPTVFSSNFLLSRGGGYKIVGKGFFFSPNRLIPLISSTLFSVQCSLPPIRNLLVSRPRSPIDRI